MLREERIRNQSLLAGEGNINLSIAKEAPLGICLIYPNTYEVGMCNLGFQSVFRLVHEHPSSFAERAFLALPSPSKSLAPLHWQHHPPRGSTTLVVPNATRTNITNAREILSMESQKRLTSFDVLAFSLSFEGDYLNVLSILAAAKIPLPTAQRQEREPLLIAGGAAVSLNPEPLADFFDAFFIGEAEAGFATVLDIIATYKRQGRNKEDLLEALARNCPAIYYPKLQRPFLYRPALYHPDGGAEQKAASVKTNGQTEHSSPTVSRAFLPDLEKTSTYQAILPSYGEFADMFLMEISRGCPHRCHFCAVSYSHRKVRFRSFCSQKPLLKEGLARRGKIGLVGAAVSDHPELKSFLSYISAQGGKVGIASLRADSIDAELASLLFACGVDNIAIGCEVANEELRLQIGKRLSTQQLEEGVANLAKGGIRNIRLYFMIGVPGESEEDCLAIAALARKLRECAQRSAPSGGFGRITLSLNLFIPKAGTPLERARLLELDSARRRMALLRKALAKEKGITFSSTPLKEALIQALLAQGDRSVGELLRAAYENGGNWQPLIKGRQDVFEQIVYRSKGEGEPLPWSFIENATT